MNNGDLDWGFGPNPHINLIINKNNITITNSKLNF